MNASQKDYQALSSSLPLGDSLFSLSYSVRFVKNFFLLFSKPFRRFSTRFELFRPPPLAKQLIYITRLHPHCQELFLPFSLFFFRLFVVRFAPPLQPAASLILGGVSDAARLRCLSAIFFPFYQREVGFLLPFQYLCLRFSASHVIMTQIHLLYTIGRNTD